MQSWRALIVAVLADALVPVFLPPGCVAVWSAAVVPVWVDLFSVFWVTVGSAALLRVFVARSEVAAAGAVPAAGTFCLSPHALSSVVSASAATAITGPDFRTLTGGSQSINQVYAAAKERLRRDPLHAR